VEANDCCASQRRGPPIPTRTLGPYPIVQAALQTLKWVKEVYGNNERSRQE